MSFRDRIRDLFGLAPDTLIEYKVHNYAKETTATSLPSTTFETSEGVSSNI